MSYFYDIYRPEQGMSQAGQALSCMLKSESPGKSYAEVMRLRVSGALCPECNDTYFVALQESECVSRLWYGWGRHECAIGNFGNFLTLDTYRGQGIGTKLLEMWYDDLQGRGNVPLALFCTSAPRAALMYAQYGMRPISDGATYGPSYMPLGDSPARFSDFCEMYYQPADQLISRPASFAYRHEIDCLLRFALLQRGLPFGIGGMPSVEQALLTQPHKTAMLFTGQDRCVGWIYDGVAQMHPAYTGGQIAKTI